MFVEKAGKPGGTLFDLFLSVPLDIIVIDATAIGTPVGWGDPTGGLLFFGPDASPGTSFIEWADDAGGTYDLGMSKALSGFSFRSSVEIASPVRFALNGGTAFDVAVQVSSVPEPPALTLLGGVLGACLLIQQSACSQSAPAAHDDPSDEG